MASIKDVAKLAGVGVGTVSRVINNRDLVSAKTRLKVHQAIEVLGFVPNEVARNFKLQTSNLVALLVPTIWHPYFSKIAYFIEDELDKVGMKVMFCNSEGKPEKEKYYLGMLRKNKVAGMIGITYNHIEDLLSMDIPMVSIDRQFGDAITCVSADNFEGGRLALRELLAAGCKKPLYIGGVTEVGSEVMERKAGFLFEAEQQGIAVQVFEWPQIEVALGSDMLIQPVFDQISDYDGVFAISDMVAAAYISLAKERGISVPADVKVIGFDGIQTNAYFHPILSTIEQPVKEIVELAVKLLMEKITNPRLPATFHRLPVRYLKGETT
jgi:LacI family transcriptional regulator